MTGYVRVDTSNNIADGNVISAADLDGEFDGVQAGFSASTGHKHDGSAGEGAPITKIGPAQDVTASATLLAPKTTNTMDLGSSLLSYKDLYLSGTVIASSSTANSIPYFNGSKSLTSGSTLTFDGTTLAVNTIASSRINSRTSTASSTATLTPDISAFDQYDLTAQAVSLTVAAPTGTPVNGNKLILRILDNGTSQTITWNATYTVIGTTLPTVTVINKMIYVGCIYNSTNTRWDVVAVTTQA